MLNLTGLALFCLLTLVGLSFYRGESVLPATEGANAGEAAQIWIMWGAMVAVPLITAILWVVRLAARDRE